MAGIVASQVLVRQAKIRSVVTDLRNYQTAFNVFKLEYGQYPGDLNRAEDYWGSDASCPDTPTNTTPKQATCNGNGNGKIAAEGDGHGREMYRSWQQLANAGLISGDFTGARGSDHALHHVPGLNSPAGVYPQSGYSVEYEEYKAGNTALFEGKVYSQFLWFGSATIHRPQDPLLYPKEIYAIEKKLDDLKPAKGYVRAYHWSTCTDAADENDTNSDYDLANNTIGCTLLYLF